MFYLYINSVKILVNEKINFEEQETNYHFLRIKLFNGNKIFDGNSR